MSTSLTLFYYYSFDFMSRLLNFTSIYWTCFFLTISATTCVPYLTPYSIFLAKKKPNQLSLKAWDNQSVPISDLIDPIPGIFLLHHIQSEQYKIWERTITPSLPSDFRNSSQAERQKIISKKSQRFKILRNLKQRLQRIFQLWIRWIS